MPITKKIRQTTRNRKNKNLAIPAAAAAIPVNPKSAATSAIIRKIKAQRSVFFTSWKTIALVNRCARFFNLPNPKRLRNTLSLHNEHNSVNHPYSSVDWSVTYLALQPGLGLLSQWRTRFDSLDSDNSGVGRWNLTSARMGPETC